uniref:Uncharacterized protein n=1 Tax=Neogobius melanostomus TaxID=47308 RepID=A0A8C6SGG3_9GOBI
MTKTEITKKGTASSFVGAGKSSVSAGEPVRSSSSSTGDAAVEHSCSEPAVRPKVMKQASKESLHRRNTECEVYDDGTNTFFW